MSQPRFRTELRILLGCILIALAAIVIGTAKWPREEEPSSSFDARSEYRVHGTNAFAQFIKILKSEKRFEQKWQIMELLPEIGCKAMPLIPYVFSYTVAMHPLGSFESVRAYLAATFFLSTNDCPGFLDQALAQLAHDDPSVRNLAASLLAPFGPSARDAIPSLVKMFDEGSGNAALALAAIHPDLPLLPERLIAKARSTSVHWFDRACCLEALQVLGPKAARVATETSQLLRNPPNLPPRGKRRVPGPEIPISRDWDADVITALGRMGPAASNTLPAIKAYLTNSLPSRRLIAARSIVQIQPDAPLLVPILTDVFEERDIPAFDFVFGVGFPDRVARSSIRGPGDFPRFLQMHSLTAAACLLGEIGPAAKDALPALEGLAGIPGTSENLFATWAIARIRGEEKAFAVRLLEELDSPGHLRFGGIEYVVTHFLVRLGADGEFALPRLEVLARNSSGPVQTAAQQAITQIREGIERGGRQK